MATPRVSIVMPVYNASKYLEKTIRSMLAQTFTDFEFIAVNDGSKDNSLEILNRLAKEDSRLKIIDLGKNEGCPAATNHGMLAAEGEFIALMDADDISLPERLEKQVAYLETHPDVGMLATQYSRMDPEDKVMRRTHNGHGDAVLKFHLLFGVPVCNPTIMFRKRISDELKPDVFRAQYSVAQDYDFMLRIADKGQFHILPEYLFYYRIHPAAMGTTNRDKVMEQVLARALPYIAEKAPELARHEIAVEKFIRLQRDNSKPMNGTMLKDYMRGLGLLREGYIRHVNAADRRAIQAFCFELEAKTLLGRYKLFKKPGLLLKWVLTPRNELRFAPLWILFKLMKAA